MPTQTCSTCRLWEPPSHEDDTGTCCRFPPTPVLEAPDENGHQTLVTYWPQTYADDWCGEHQPAPEASYP